MARTRGLLRVILWPLILWTAGCGTAARQPEAPGYAARGCAPEEWEVPLPSAEALVDTAALNVALRALADEAEIGAGEVTLTMWYEPDGLNTRREVLRHSLQPAMADSVQRLVFAAGRDAPEREEPWGVRLEVDLGRRVGYRTEPRVYCPPRPRDPELENAVERPVFLGTRYRGGVRERTVVLRVTVHPMGYVAGARVIAGADSGGTLEQRLVDYVRQFSFEPARLDGIPVPGEIEVPVQIRA